MTTTPPQVTRGAVVVGQVGRARPQFLRNKKQQLDYRSEVTSFELRENLPNL
jgi:hypothetical protein